TAPGEHAAIFGMECHALHPAGRIRLLVEHFPGLGVPDLDDPIKATRGEQRPIRAERYTANSVSVREGTHDFLAGRHVPDSHSAICTGRGEPRDICLWIER